MRTVRSVGQGASRVGSNGLMNRATVTALTEQKVTLRSAAVPALAQQEIEGYIPASNNHLGCCELRYGQVSGYDV